MLRPSNSVRTRPAILRPEVSVRIRGRGETTLEAQFNDAETVAKFKARVFGGDMAEGQKCRLIASGRELRDPQPMWLYGIQEGACLHVMISKKRAEGQTKQGSPKAVVAAAAALAAPPAPPAPSSSAAPPAPAPSSSSPPGLSFIGAMDGYLILCTLTTGMLVSGWTFYMVFPELISPLSACLMLLLTLLQLAAMMPLLLRAVSRVLRACHRSSSRVPERRRQ
ncbi:unnamed protein product [Pylaiella littoralis]